MKFDELFPVPRPTTIGPHPDHYPVPDLAPELHAGGGHYPCSVCRALTRWGTLFDECSLRCCSTECYEQLTSTKPKWPKPPPPVPKKLPDVPTFTGAGDTRVPEGEPDVPASPKPTCPVCGGRDIAVVATSKRTSWECRSCRRPLVNLDEPKRLPRAVLRRKRPAMFGGLVCSCCPHEPHPGRTCPFCWPPDLRLTPPRRTKSRSPVQEG
jgi:hypothetical protein